MNDTEVMEEYLSHVWNHWPDRSPDCYYCKRLADDNTRH